MAYALGRSATSICNLSTINTGSHTLSALMPPSKHLFMTTRAGGFLRILCFTHNFLMERLEFIGVILG